MTRHGRLGKEERGTISGVALSKERSYCISEFLWRWKLADVGG